MYISPYCRPVLVLPIFMKFGIRGQLTDVITCVKFLVDRFRGYGVLTPPKLPFPIDLLRRPYNSVCTAMRYCDNDFQKGVLPPFCFVMTSSFCIRELLFKVPNIVLNFQVDRFSTFGYTWDFHVSAFWLEIVYFGPKFDVFEAIRGSNGKIQYSKPKRHILA